MALSLGMRTAIYELKQIGATIANERRYSLLWLLLIIEIAVGVVLGVQATGSPQAYDADDYAREALQMASGDGSWLAFAHNYLYPAFLALLHALGLWSSGDSAGRLAVGLVQLTLLYSASLVLMAVLSRCLHMRRVSVAVVVAAMAIVPAAAASGYWVSEAVAIPVLLMVIALWVLTCYRVLLRPGARSTIAPIAPSASPRASLGWHVPRSSGSPSWLVSWPDW
jgi:hypothetical protein